MCPTRGIARAMMRSWAMFWKCYRQLGRPDLAAGRLELAVAFREKAKQLE